MAKIIIILISLIVLISCSPKKYLISGNIEAPLKSSETGFLDEVLNEQNIRAEYVLLITSDGIAVLLSERSFPLIKIAKEGSRFQTSSSYLPPVSNLNDLIEISIYNSDHPLQNFYTPFSSRMNDFQFLGESSRDGHFVRKYQLKEDITSEK